MNYEPHNAPRITRNRIEGDIALIGYFAGNADFSIGIEAPTLIDAALRMTAKRQMNRVTFCVIVFKTGAIVTGKSIVAHTANYDEQKGKDAAYEDAIREAWPLFGFSLASRINDMAFYIDKGGVTRHPDGEESFSQLAQDDAGRAAILALVGDHEDGPIQPPTAEARRAMRHSSDGVADGSVAPDSQPVGG